MWGACDQNCTGGVKTRTRTCSDATGANRGQDCGPALQETIECENLTACVGKYCSLDITHNHLIIKSIVVDVSIANVVVIVVSATCDVVVASSVVVLSKSTRKMLKQY